MTVYARSDVAAVSISTEHGGCGESHSRPVIEGAPAKVWALTCHGGCEDHLRGDPLWAGSIHTIPETPDETAIRLDVEKRGQAELAISNTESLAAIAGLASHLPTALAQALTQALGQVSVTAAPVSMAHLCRNGHSNGPAAKFCGECGADMSDAANKKPVAALAGAEDSSPAETEEPVTPAESEPEAGTDDLDELTYTQLKEIAKKDGLEIAPSKVAQLEIIKKARTN
jgi:hypothetical protein